MLTKKLCKDSARSVQYKTKVCFCFYCQATLTASPPSPLSLRRGGTSHLFLLIFRKYLKQEAGEKKVTSVPPLLKGRRLEGEAQLQFIALYRILYKMFQNVLNRR